MIISYLSSKTFSLPDREPGVACYSQLINALRPVYMELGAQVGEACLHGGGGPGR